MHSIGLAVKLTKPQILLATQLAMSLAALVILLAMS
jgi:hypothetical protein